MFLNDTACNLASLNLMKFVGDDGEFDVEAYRYACRRHDHGAGDPRRQRGLSHAQDRGELAPLPAARHGLREPRRAADVTRPRVRLAGGPVLRGGADRDHDRRGAIASRRSSPATTVARSSSTPKNESSFLRVIAKHRDAAYRIPTSDSVPADLHRGTPSRPGTTPATLGKEHGYRNAQISAARAHRHDRVHDGLRHHRDRAGHRARQVQEARRRGLPQARQRDRPGRAAQARLHGGPGRGDRRVHQRARDDRGRAGARSPSTCRSSTAPSSRSTASGPSTTWATSG